MEKIIEYFISGNLFTYRVVGITDFITKNIAFDNVKNMKLILKRIFKLYCNFDISFKRLYHKDLVNFNEDTSSEYIITGKEV